MDTKQGHTLHIHNLSCTAWLGCVVLQWFVFVTSGTAWRVLLLRVTGPTGQAER